jgi:hypothetical protein
LPTRDSLNYLVHHWLYVFPSQLLMMERDPQVFKGDGSKFATKNPRVHLGLLLYQVYRHHIIFIIINLHTCQLLKANQKPF